jgi:exosome complex component MTR3
MKTGTIGQASGSCYIEMGSTKVICSVFGPREANTRSQYSEKGRLICDYKYAPFSLHKWKEQRQVLPCTCSTASTTHHLSSIITVTTNPLLLLSLICRLFLMAQSAEERDASRMVEQALSPSVMLDKFPKAVIDINIVVLEADGSK